MMRPIPLLLLILAAVPATAQDTRLPLAALSGDWNGDEIADAVLIYADGSDDGMAGLVLLEGDGYRGLEPVITLPRLLFSGPLAGQAPTLEGRSASSFALLTEQTAVGRTPWSQALTIAYRGGGYVVAGFDHRFYDRIDMSHGACSVNLLTGAYTLLIGPGEDAPEITREGSGAGSAFPLAELTEDYFPEVCRALFD